MSELNETPLTFVEHLDEMIAHLAYQSYDEVNTEIAQQKINEAAKHIKNNQPEFAILPIASYWTNAVLVNMEHGTDVYWNINRTVFLAQNEALKSELALLRSSKNF